MSLDACDKQLLNLIQNQFPLIIEPYKEIGRQLHISEAEVLERLQRMLDVGIIRRFGGVFDSRKLGYKGTLCALKVPAHRIEEVAQVVNRYPGITHNYLRDHGYNMWFTVLAETPDKVEKIVGEISAESGISDVLNLPAERFFKLMVHFKISEVDQDDRFGEKANPAPAVRLTPGTPPLRRTGKPI